MKKNLLQFAIAAVLLIIGYFIYDGSANESESTIKISDPVFEEVPVSQETSNTQLSSEPENPGLVDADEVSFSGTFMGFVDGKDQILGAFKYALIDDGTEIIRVDLRSIVGYDVTGLEEQLGVEKNNRVTIRGFIEGGEFVATVIKSE